MKKIISLIIVCMIIISGMFIYGKSDKKDLLEDSSGPIMAAVIDGKASTTFPTTNKYVATVECTRNGVKQDVGAKATWNGTKWVVSFNDISAGNVRCNVNFETKKPAPNGWYEAGNGTLLASLRNSNTLKTPITTPGVAVSIAEALLAAADDDYGTSYYFRGTVTNNYVEFANKCWRIVRIGGDGSIKLILHNDNTAGATNPCDAANNSASAAFARYSGTTYTSAFNEKYDDNAYVGFMYGTAGSSDYKSTHANINKSTILTNIETWYNNNLKKYENVIDNTVWCNDQTNVTDTTYDPWRLTPNGLGYAENVTYYGATQRLVSTSNRPGGTGPSLKCNGELSKITSKIGLITADELAYAGYAYNYNISGNTTYLQENATDTYWWSLSPGGFRNGSTGVWSVNGSSGRFSIYGNVSSGLRPSISLKSTTNVTGEGTSEKPYVVN